ncbi:hypothetical protein F4777DRAFT_519173 [Nemania sp. FL0916]|nr:hypothetical protein F4777DRAFT_519173 [Nemania sp. FL0916]
MTSKPDHLQRTAAEPRDKSLNTVVLEHIDEVNDTTRLFRLAIPRGAPPFRFLPGQWLDVYVPGVEKAGGFTITSPPAEARRQHPSDSNNDNTNNKVGPGGPYIELAIQKSPSNPPAAWLWRNPPTSLLGSELRVRVGGSFVWPPPGINARALRRVVFVAGGVGVNPLVAMLSHLASAAGPSSSSSGHLEVRFLYSLRDPDGKPRDAKRMLFLERIARVFRRGAVKGRLELFLTGGPENTGEGEGKGGESSDGGDEGERVIVCDGGDGDDDEDSSGPFPIPFYARRCTVEQDVASAVGSTPTERRFAVVYVCGPPAMTDEFVAKLTDPGDGGLAMEPHRVLCEKWW